MRDGEQVGAVVPHGPVPVRRVAERVAVHLGAGQPGQVLGPPGAASVRLDPATLPFSRAHYAPTVVSGVGITSD